MFKEIAGIVLTTLLWCNAIPADAVGFGPVTDQELALTPEHCRPIRGADHYCDALINILRADRSTGFDRMAHLGTAKVQLWHMLYKEIPPDWVSVPEAHVKLGEVILLLAKRGKGSEGEAVINFQKAIQLAPDYVPAYVALGDYYIDGGQKQKALEILEEGLKQAPDSKALGRRFSGLGGKLPVVQPAPGKPVTVETGEGPAPTKTQPEAVSAPAATVTQAAAPSPATTNETAPTRIGSPQNPWCRFCPDIDSKPDQK